MPPRRKKASEVCTYCHGTAFVDAVDNHGQPYRGCASCVIKAVPEICAFVDAIGKTIEHHELDYPHPTVTLVRSDGVAEVYARREITVARSSTSYTEAQYHLVHWIDATGTHYPETKKETIHATP